jgi:hypothetical protein
MPSKPERHVWFDGTRGEGDRGRSHRLGYRDGLTLCDRMSGIVKIGAC